jgi:hypothetical protein
MQVRYDEQRGIYRDCKFCGGKGCLACPGEADKEYKRQFPNGPQPIATFKRDNPEDMARLKEFMRKTLSEMDHLSVDPPDPVSVDAVNKGGFSITEVKQEPQHG